jgi:hypothetical protein
MAHDVFISYSTKDKNAANALCARLEGLGIRCWVAPRDIPPGADWAGAIIDAIDESRMMVLIFSSHSNQSKQVRREVYNAVESAVTIIPVRIDEVKPTSAMRYYLGPQHWLDALTPPLEERLEDVADIVQLLVSERQVEPEDVEAAEAATESTGSSAPQPAPSDDVPSGPDTSEEATRQNGRHSGKRSDQLASCCVPGSSPRSPICVCPKSSCCQLF